MEEKDIAMNALLACRHMADLLHTFGCEASSDIVDDVKSAYDAVTTLQHDTYDMMVQNEWMKVKYETKSKLEKAYAISLLLFHSHTYRDYGWCLCIHPGHSACGSPQDQGPDDQDRYWSGSVPDAKTSG